MTIFKTVKFLPKQQLKQLLLVNSSVIDASSIGKTGKQIGFMLYSKTRLIFFLELLCLTQFSLLDWPFETSKFYPEHQLKLWSSVISAVINVNANKPGEMGK